MVSNRRSLVALKASWLIKVIGQAEAAVGAKLHSHDHFVQPFKFDANSISTDVICKTIV